MDYELGQLYIIEFLDHAIHCDFPITCQVVGWVVKNDPDYVVLNTWYCMVDDPEIEENNRECVVIVKSTISMVFEVT